MLHLQSLGDLRLRGPAGDLLRQRRKEIALLVVLAARAPRPVRREEVQALFWGERDEQRARHSLRQVLLRLRRTCGDDLIEVTRDTLCLSHDRISFDVREFTTAASAGRFGDAIELWTGDFMVACEDVGGEDFTAWFEAERERLRRSFYACFERLVTQLAGAREWSEAARWSTRWVQHFRFDELAAERHIEALCSCGNAALADAERAAFVQRLATELEDEPSREWLDRTQERIDAARAAAPLVVKDDVAAIQSGHEPPRKRLRKRVTMAAVVVALLAIAAWRIDLLGLFRGHQTILAVGSITALGMPDSAQALPSLLAINLGRAPGLSILSEGRVQELRVQMRSRGNVRGDIQRAALAAGATEIMEGVIARRSDGVLRLDLQRIDLESHESRATYSLEGKDLFSLVDAAAERIARDFGVELSADLLAGTRSLSATRLYDEGLRAYYSGEATTAGRLFRLALREDSTFAMAAYYAARVQGMPNTSALMRHALRMSRHGSDRDRLFILAHWLTLRDEPSQLAVAETLAIRYPAEPAAHFAHARALVRFGRFLDAVPRYRRVIEMDSLGLRGEHARCLACDAYNGVLEAYRLADSMPASERIAREWLRRQPGSAGAWAALSSVHKVQGRFREASDGIATAASLDRTNSLAVTGMMDLWLRAGDFDAADRFWTGLLATPGHDLRDDALFDAVSSLRLQGRLSEALDAALQVRGITSSRGQPLGGGYTHAAVLYDIGRYRESAALFDSVSAPDTADSQARQGRNRAWFLTHAATAVAMLRDTAHLHRLEDTIRVYGARSGYGRDQLLHHYVRGLRLRLAGNTAAAVDEFRRSLYSPVEGNTRASLELARTLLDSNRAAEAVGVLRSAHWGPIGASGQYINRTELEWLLARAYEATGQTDSAAAHYKWVLHAWSRPDTMLFDARREVQQRYAAVQPGR
ncbi:MAG TPA: BTAD domain-containing putative transcriptional regulator [Longimicrobiales bacterium]|nr:BTAD domain-containing putative transcriptional regulator [Longimicrobiales bacterium]